MVDFNNARIKEEDGLEENEDGTFSIPIDLSEEDRILIFEAFMLDYKFNSCSIKTFNDILNSSSNVDKAISDAVLNEFALKSLESAIFNLKDKIKEELVK